MLDITFAQAVSGLGAGLLIGGTVWFVSKSRVMLLVVALLLWFTLLRWWYQW